MKKVLTVKYKKPNLEDKKYFEEVYREYFDRLFAYALVITRSESLAKDVVSDVFFNLYNAQTNLRSIRELKSYLFTSTKNQAIRCLSQDPLQFESENFDQVANSIDKVNPEDLMVGKELDEFLHQVIADLPDTCSLVFSLVREKGMKYSEVATELGISVDTVKYHVKTALKKIKSELEGRYDDSKVIDWYSTGLMMLMIGSDSVLNS
ncbi:RNA polymerase sigma factor [Marinoscillum sp. MHG1-6]|uniref:RNA polymerase sigma factor n=1 Tax=Marinoscillum sp. MHG1-6 TaxID=2959627 RepID=UPI00215848E6|nr:RNA polymerase sigma-70 factor [Marinoscillum sp. MHG1-6]